MNELDSQRLEIYKDLQGNNIIWKTVELHLNEKSSI